MRAVVIESIDIACLLPGTELNIQSDDQIHHLRNVVRLKVGEKIIGLNGSGYRIYLDTRNIERNIITFEILKVESSEPLHNMSVTLGAVKKEALEDAVRLCVELGIRKLIVTKTKFSQPLETNDKFHQRMKAILNSALIQSNNMYYPELVFNEKFESSLLEISKERPIVCFGMKPNRLKEGDNLNRNFKNAHIVIGPEGGLDEREEEFLIENCHANYFNLETPILRSENAIAVAVGYILGIGRISD